MLAYKCSVFSVFTVKLLTNVYINVGKASNLKPCRPAPPPPPGQRPLDTQSSPEQPVSSLTTVSSNSLPSTCQVDAPPQAPLLPEARPIDLIQPSEKIPSYLTVPPPSPLPASPTALEDFPLFQTSPVEDEHANIQVSNTCSKS